MPNQNQRPPVTLEQLLKLKRAERPDPEFWVSFEAELRQKQLAALVHRRTWWQSLPQLFSPRAYLPIGASAILAFTLVSVRYYAPTTVAATSTEAPVEQNVPEVAPSVPGVPYVAREVEPVEQPEQFVAQEIDDRTAVAAKPLSETMPERVGSLVPWGAAATVEESPSSRAITANLAQLQETDPDLVNLLLGGPFGEHSRVQELALPMEMAAVSAVTSRRSKLLAQFADRQFTPDPAAPEVFVERMGRRMGEMELAGGWGRVDLKSDRVSVKF